MRIASFASRCSRRLRLPATYGTADSSFWARRRFCRAFLRSAWLLSIRFCTSAAVAALPTLLKLSNRPMSFSFGLGSASRAAGSCTREAGIRRLERADPDAVGVGVVVDAVPRAVELVH